MFSAKYSRCKFFSSIALLISTTAITPWLVLTPASAEPLFRSPGSAQGGGTTGNTYYNQSLVPAGTQIPVDFEKEKILVTKEETVPVTLKVAANLKTPNGVTLIPFGTQIVGKIQPVGGGSQATSTSSQTVNGSSQSTTTTSQSTGAGSQFVAEKIVFSDGRQFPLNANSAPVTRTEVVKKGANTGDILEGAAIGAAASAVLSGIFGKIDVEEVLGGAGVGALAGWLLGGNQAELISIDPKTDLAVTLNSDLVLR
jgi:hypothetical protein